jgi:TRAP-type uncharacterized transport system substrate-binding protein
MDPSSPCSYLGSKWNKKLADLRGRRVSIGAPGSGTEIRSTRALEVLGIDAYKDLNTERLSFAESADGLGFHLSHETAS